MTVAGRCRYCAASSLVAITASMRAMRKLVSHVFWRWEAELKISAKR